jgi:hypothetical protein
MRHESRSSLAPTASLQYLGTCSPLHTSESPLRKPFRSIAANQLGPLLALVGPGTTGLSPGGPALTRPVVKSMNIDFSTYFLSSRSRGCVKAALWKRSVKFLLVPQ